MPDDYAKIIVAANHGELTRVRNAMAISGTINAIKCHVEFRTKDWNVLNKTIVFARGKATASTPKEDIFPPQVLDDSNECIVPPGVLNEKYFSIGLIGFEEGYRIVTNWLHYRVEDGCYAEGGATFDPPKTIYDEILEELKNHNHDERYYTKEESDELLEGAWKAIQPDWNQNDSSAKNYIKNRPFYSSIVDVTLLDGTFDFAEGGLPGIYAYSQESALTFEEGKTYIVVFDRTSYSCTGYLPAEGAPAVLGNASMLDPSVSGGNNEPFIILNDGQLVIATNLTDASHTVKITVSEESINKIDAKYLPDEIRETPSSKMDKINPTGTGSFSLNREADTTIGDYSFAEGYRTTASGSYSHAEGWKTTASGTHSHAEGRQTTASGGMSHAEGSSTNKFSIVVNTTNPTNDDIITAWKSRKFSVAKGNSSHVEGLNSLALGDDSHAEGDHTTASGASSHAEGHSTTASSNASHAEGVGTKASDAASHAEGWNTTASSTASHAEGEGTKASGAYSHAEGSYTTASSNRQHVQGKYNIADSSNTYADIIGNGTGVSARSNAATVDWSGNAWYAGDVYVGSTSGANKDAGSKKLATEEYVDSKQVQSDYNQNDPSAKDYIKNKPAIATDDDAMDFLAEMGMITPVTNSNGEILISSSNEIYSL